MIAKALTLYELTRGPLMLDVIRALADPKTPPVVLQSVECYVMTQYEAYLLLFPESATTNAHGNPEHIPHGGG